MATLFETENDVIALQEAKARQNANADNPRMGYDPINDIRSQVRANRSYNMRRGGNLIGAGIDKSGLLGDSVTLNPEVKRASDINSIKDRVSSQHKFGTPDFFKSAATELAAAGYTQEALSALDTGINYEKQMASIDKDKASAYASRNPTAAKIVLNPFRDTVTGKDVTMTDASVAAINAVTPNRFVPVPKVGDKPSKLQPYIVDGKVTMLNNEDANAVADENPDSIQPYTAPSTAKVGKPKPYFDRDGNEIMLTDEQAVEMLNNDPSSLTSYIAPSVLNNKDLTSEEKVDLHLSIDNTSFSRLPVTIQNQYTSDLYKNDPVARDKAIKKHLADIVKAERLATKDELAEERMKYAMLTDLEKGMIPLNLAKAKLKADPENEELKHQVELFESKVNKLAGYEPIDNTGRLTDAAIDLNAEQFLATGAMPSLGRSENASIARMQVANRAAEILAERGTGNTEAVVNRQIITFNNAAGKQIAKQFRSAEAFEKLAVKNADIALGLSKKVYRIGIPAVDKWLIKGQKNITGDPDTAEFYAANMAFVSEFAKIMSGSMGNTPVSDALRKETNEMLSTKYDHESYSAVVKLMKMEMQNRIDGFKEEEQIIQDNIERALSNLPEDEGGTPRVRKKWGEPR